MLNRVFMLFLFICVCVVSSFIRCCMFHFSHNFQTFHANNKEIHITPPDPAKRRSHHDQISFFSFWLLVRQNRQRVFYIFILFHFISFHLLEIRKIKCVVSLFLVCFFISFHLLEIRKIKCVVSILFYCLCCFFFLMKNKINIFLKIYIKFICCLFC